MLRIPQNSSITGTSPSDCLVSYQDTHWGGASPLCRGSSVYSTAPANYAKLHSITNSIFVKIRKTFRSILTLRLQPWPIRLAPPGNFRRHSTPRLCLPIRDHCYHSPRCVFWSEWQCFSYLRSFPIWAGVHAEIKSLLGERLYPSRLTKVHRKKENNAFKFLKAFVFI